MRPSAQSQGPPGSSKNFGKMVEGRGDILNRATGGDIDFWIRSADEFDDHSEPRFMKVRGMRALADVFSTQAESSPETDLYGRLFCEKCQQQISAGALCGPCANAYEGANLCTAPNKSASGFAACNNVRYLDHKVCRGHAEEQGLIAKIEPRTLCASRDCLAEPSGAYRFCAAHLVEFGILVAAAPLATAPQVRARKGARKPKDAKKETQVGDRVPAKRGAAAHREGCACVFCSRRNASLIAAGHAETQGH